jgi:hypothetical protein
MFGRALFIFFFTASALLSGVITQDITFSRRQFNITKEAGYDIITLSGQYLTGEKGKPQLPWASFSILLPPTAEIIDVKVVDYKAELLPGDFTPYPVQTVRPLSSKRYYPFVEPDASVYNSHDPYPREIVTYVSTGCLSGYRIAGINIFPVQYLPAEKRLKLYTNIKLKINYEEGQHQPVRLTQSQTELFSKEVKNMVLNPEAVDRWSPSLKDLRDNEVDYVIITGASLVSNWDALKNWKIKKGLKTEVVSTNTIYSQYTGRDNQEKIRNFIIDYWQNKGLKWVLLGGDDFIVPDRKTRLIIEDSTITGNIPTDMYYADLQWSWDGNNNNYFGEMEDTVDLLHDVYIGRAPVDNATNIATFIYKDTIFEKNPDPNYLKTLLLPSEMLFSPYHGRVINNLIASYFPAGWKISKLEDPGYGETRDSLNRGYQFCHIAAHGNTSSLSVLSMSEIPSLNNGIKYNIMNAINCYCGAFDDGDCIAESLVNYPNGACIATMLNARYGLGYPPALGPSEMLDLEFYKCFWNMDLIEIGAAHGMSKNNLRNLAMSQPATRWCVFCLNLFGDPNLAMWSTTPQTMDVNYVSLIPASPQVFRVSVDISDSLIENALVCAMKGSEVYAAGRTNSGGWVDLFVNPTTTGTMHVTATSRDCLPYEGTCTVTSGSPAPCIVYQSNLIDDSSGNNDGHLDPGETANLFVALKNAGNASATNVTSILRTGSSYITLLDSTSSYGSMNAGDSANGDQFVISVSSSTPQGHDAEFISYTTADQGTWEPFFEEIVGVPPEPKKLWADHDTGSCAFTVTTNGSFGTTHLYGEGSGFKYSKIASYGCLFYGSMLAGTDPSYIVDRFYSHPASNIDDDFAIVDTLVALIPPLLADEEYEAYYNDSNHPASKGLEVHQWSLAVSDAGYDDWVIVCFNYHNFGSNPISNFYSGMMFDFDIYNTTNNIVKSDIARRFTYMMRRTTSQRPTAGIRLLAPTAAANLSALDHAVYVEPSSMMTEAVKDSFLNGEISLPNSTRRDNWSVCVSAGPFDIPVNGKVRVVYAIIGGDDESTALINSDSAQSWWDQNTVEVEEYDYDQLHTEISITPNPASKIATICYTTRQKEKIIISVFDACGRLVEKIFEGRVDGKKIVRWKPEKLATGVYFLKVENPGNQLIKKLIYIR